MLTHTKIGRYEVVGTLGQGAMGTVYRAVDPLIERTVALKTINLDLAEEDRAEFEERFYREAKSAGRLSHANIVTIYDVGETDDVAYIAMEYLEGETLREMLDSGVVLPVDRIVRIAARIAQALHYAHENQVVHRDIKPANIMITAQRDVKIMDFGIAQIPTGARTQHGTVLGSPNYMAPEQVKSEPTDGKTDIFALGVVLYEMLTGISPFKGDNISAIMFKILHAEPAPPSTLNPRVPPALDGIVARAMAKRAEDRHATAGELARELSLLLDPSAGETAATEAERAPATATRNARRATHPADATVVLAPDQVARVRKRAEPTGSGPMAAALAAFADSPPLRKGIVFVLPVVMLLAFLVYSSVWQGRPGAESGSPLTGDAGARARPAPQIVADGKPDTIAPLLPPVSIPAAPTPPPQPAATASGGGAGPGATAGIPTDMPAAAARPATVTLAIAPWGEIVVDGKSAGVSPPLNRLELAPGRHRIEIRNQAFAAYRETVTLEPGASIRIRHKFK